MQLLSRTCASNGKLLVLGACINATAACRSSRLLPAASRWSPSNLTSPSSLPFCAFQSSKSFRTIRSTKSSSPSIITSPLEVNARPVASLANSWASTDPNLSWVASATTQAIESSSSTDPSPSTAAITWDWRLNCKTWALLKGSWA